ncbi:MAG TPA: OsmC family protein [Sphingomicrobium sp.]|nr:OsmC family protein [Sphingomicrobium sp.]
MSTHHATIRWFSSPGEDFAKGQYSRAHSWNFDGLTNVAASASPHIVPMPWANPDAVDPEEAFVASASACHMLFFLDFARRAGMIVTSYEDEAEGLMERGEDGKTRITRITLRPKIVYGGDGPDQATLDQLHHKAHEACFIANSITSEVVIEQR